MTSGDLVGNKIAKTVSETTREDTSNSKRTAKVDEALIQPTEIPKEICTTRKATTYY